MTATGEEGFDDLLESILDGRPIDWAAAESTASREDRELLDRLKVLATLASVHRDSSGEDDVLERGRWGHLRVLELIGRGANGAVYRAWDETLDREVALKILPAPGDDGDQPVAGAPVNPVIEEGRTLARVRHPNVVTIYGADHHHGRVGLWMERVAGRTLDEIVKSGKRFTPREVAAIGAELCEAVAAVHAAGLVHRDIKASNVMIRDDGRPVLMDFGTGSEIDDTEATLAGTPLYLAPELFRGAHATPRRDIYSVGVLLYHLLTGSYPVRGADFRELRQAHDRGDRHDLRGERTDVPAKLAAALDRAIDPDPERRHPNAETLAADLRSIARPRFGRVLRAVAAMAGLLLLGVVAWEISSAIRGRPSPSRALVAGLGERLATVGSPDVRAEPPAIVVLPFDDLGDATGGAHLADGLAEEILHELARVDGLDVRSRHSSFSFRDRPLDLRAVRDRLDVNLALTGSVVRSGDRLRVTAQLVDLAADRALWSDRWDRHIDSSLDLFAITDDIARSIVNELRLKLGTGQRRYDLDLQTYDLYLSARALTEVGRSYSSGEAVDLFEQVIARDPAFAPAYAGLADAYFFGSMPASVAYPGRVPVPDANAKIRESAERALELDPLLADAHAAMGVVYARENDWETSIRSFNRALELDPSRTSTYTRYSFSTLRPLRRNDEAWRLLDIAREKDPLSLDVQMEIGQLELCTGRYDDAVATLERVNAAQPSIDFLQVFLVRALTFAGRLDDAFAKFEAMGKEGFPAWYALALVRAGRRAEAEALAALHRDNSHRSLFISAALGDLDSAFAALERQAVQDPQRVPMILTYPELAILYGDPRLEAIRQRFRLPPAPVNSAPM